MQLAEQQTFNIVNDTAKDDQWAVKYFLKFSNMRQTFSKWQVYDVDENACTALV
jgi:hypothetical protein